MIRSFLMCAVTLLLSVTAGAAEYAPRSYTDQEEQALRQWEQQWVGTKITSANVDAVAEYLAPPVYKVFKNPDKWCAPPEGYYFHIAPYQRIVETDGMVAATQKYAPQVQVDQHGTITNYADIAGFPFPEPHTGQQVAWNYDFNTRGDSSFYRRYTPNVDTRLKQERVQDADCWELFYAHRVDVDPRPVLNRNRKGMHWAGFYHMYKPNEYLNMRIYNIRYLDANTEDTRYMWNSQTRRMTRMSGAQRYDKCEGSIVVLEDEYCWNAHITRNTYTLVGRKELLAGRHIKVADVTRVTNQVLYNNAPRERVKTYVVEAVNKNRDYVYGKRVWYIDPETFLILGSDIYDPEGRYWKYIEQFCEDVPTRQGQMKNYLIACHVLDFQNGYTAATRQRVKDIGLKVSTSMFTPGYLQRTY